MTTGMEKSLRQRLAAIGEALLSLAGQSMMRVLYRVLGFRYFYSAKQSVRPTAELIRRTQRSLCVLSGELNGAVWNAPDVREALREVIGRPNPPQITIIYTPSPHVNPEALEYLRSLARAGQISLYALPWRGDRHFWAADGRHVKVEEPHGPAEESRRGYVAFDASRLAATLEERMRFALRQSHGLDSGAS